MDNIPQDYDFEIDYGTLTDELCRECKNGYYIKSYVENGIKEWVCNSCGAVESN